MDPICVGFIFFTIFIHSIYTRSSMLRKINFSLHFECSPIKLQNSPNIIFNLTLLLVHAKFYYIKFIQCECPILIVFFKVQKCLKIIIQWWNGLEVQVGNLGVGEMSYLQLDPSLSRYSGLNRSIGLSSSSPLLPYSMLWSFILGHSRNLQEKGIQIQFHFWLLS